MTLDRGGEHLRDNDYAERIPSARAKQAIDKENH